MIIRIKKTFMYLISTFYSSLLMLNKEGRKGWGVEGMGMCEIETEITGRKMKKYRSESSMPNPLNC